MKLNCSTAEPSNNRMKGKRIPADGSVNDTLRSVLASLLKTEDVKAVMAQSRIPSKESFALLLIQDPKLLEAATPLAPVMPVQAARALQSLGRGNGLPRILCALRACEARAAVELAKRKQVNLENVLLLTIDCPGAFPTRDYIKAPEEFDRRFEEVLKGKKDDGLRPDCKSCVGFSSKEVASDIHIGLLRSGEVAIVHKSDRGESLLAAAGLAADEDVSDWEAAAETEAKARAETRDKAFLDMKGKAAGADGLDKLFADCVNCHNCMRVCPICYCRQCYFDSGDSVRLRAEDYIARAKNRGGIRFPGEMMQFHLGRMYHMALSCVACGACEDACPVDVPVSRVFAFVGARIQKDFDYVPGRSREEAMPMTTFEEDELHEFEDASCCSTVQQLNSSTPSEAK